MKDIEIAYLAGLIDGEGSFSIQVDSRKTKKGIASVRFNPRITMTLQYGSHALDVLVDCFGGKIYDYGSSGRKYYLGKIDDVKYATNELIPYLIVKKAIAIRFLETLNKFPERRANHLNHERTWPKELALEVAEVALTLNSASTKRERKNLSYLEEIREIYATN